MVAYRRRINAASLCVWIISNGFQEGAGLERLRCLKRRCAWIPLLTVAGPARTLGREGRFLRTRESCNQVARSIAEGSKLNEFI